MKNKFTTYTRKTGVEIPFKGQVITLLIDTNDLQKVDLAADKWGIYTDPKGRLLARSDKASGQKLLHKVLYDLPRGAWLEWINGNTLDLRPENIQVRHPDGIVTPWLLPEPEPEPEEEPYTHKSDVRGVYFHKASQRWCASAFYEGRRYSIGYQPDTPEGKRAAEEAVADFRLNGPQIIKGAN